LFPLFDRSQTSRYCFLAWGEFAPEGEGISPNDGRNVLLLAGEIEDYDAPPTP
jgi:hypothetical protein